MSNHEGGHMLHDVLLLLEKNGTFEFWGTEKTRNFIADVIKISENHDCNHGEVLEGIGERLKICYCCLKPAKKLENGLCRNCRGE